MLADQSPRQGGNERDFHAFPGAALLPRVITKCTLVSQLGERSALIDRRVVRLPSDRFFSRIPSDCFWRRKIETVELMLEAALTPGACLPVAKLQQRQRSSQQENPIGGMNSNGN
jgi:hypothetical protein